MDKNTAQVVVDQCVTVWPSTRGNSGVSGRIPIAMFNKIETVLRPAMRALGMRVWYRGPRRSNNASPSCVASATRRCDATHAVIYRA